MDKDIKYLGIPNICFSLTKEDDEREVDFAKDRIERGFDDSETWSLRDTISNFIIPRLERYEEITRDVLKREDHLVEGVDELLESFKLITRDNGSQIWTKEEEEKVRKGLEQFPKVFLSLWW